MTERLELGTHLEYFELRGRVLRRKLKRRDHSSAHSTIKLPSSIQLQNPIDRSQSNLAELFDLAWLRSTKRPPTAIGAEEVRVVDLFAGCGGLSIGIAEACRALGLRAHSVLANDFDQETLQVFGRNFPEAKLEDEPIEKLLDSDLGQPLSPAERRLKTQLGKVHLVIGGPPCQGHSDFNNHTRNADPKNALYLKMARFCEVVGPDHVIIENVPGVERDRLRSAEHSRDVLRALRYQVSTGVIDTSHLGVAQRRKRSITLASRSKTFEPSVANAVSDLRVEQEHVRWVLWAIGDLESMESDELFDSPTQPSEENFLRMQRLQKLLLDGEYELPDEYRPNCHRLKPHTYKAVYGRMRGDRPAPTITTGFGSMGRGRFVHPLRPRTLTPHEAARIQFFPDFYDFGNPTRTKLHRMIGNAVPPKLGYVLGIHLLR